VQTYPNREGVVQFWIWGHFADTMIRPGDGNLCSHNPSVGLYSFAGVKSGAAWRPHRATPALGLGTGSSPHSSGRPGTHLLSTGVRAEALAPAFAIRSIVLCVKQAIVSPVTRPVESVGDWFMVLLVHLRCCKEMPELGTLYRKVYCAQSSRSGALCVATGVTTVAGHLLRKSQGDTGSRRVRKGPVLFL
jgi:hypothetical protein